VKRPKGEAVFTITKVSYRPFTPESMSER
jgi:hypothetical protein